MATEVSTPAMPQLQSVQKAMAIPSVGAAVGQFGAFYSRVKGAHSLLEWALSTAEASVSIAATAAVPFVAGHLAAGDAKIAACIDELERRVPLVSEEPKVIVETTKQAVMTKISPHVNKVCGAKAAAEQRVKSLKELSWTKANVLLSTVYGQKAMHSVDMGASYAMQLLDHYLPPVIGAADETSTEIVAATTDPAMHTVQTVGRLSSVAARRVWANLSYKVNELRNQGKGIELDVRRYIAALLAALHLAKVTSEQQQRENEAEDRTQPRQKEMSESYTPSTSLTPQKTQESSPPTSPLRPQKTQESSPTTSHVVKTTPEGKSNVAQNGNSPNFNQ